MDVDAAAASSDSAEGVAAAKEHAAKRAKVFGNVRIAKDARGKREAALVVETLAKDTAATAAVAVEKREVAARIKASTDAKFAAMATTKSSSSSSGSSRNPYFDEAKKARAKAEIKKAKAKKARAKAELKKAKAKKARAKAELKKAKAKKTRARAEAKKAKAKS